MAARPGSSPAGPTLCPARPLCPTFLPPCSRTCPPASADPDVLWLHYEDLHEDLAAGVALIARFLGLGADDDELQALAVQQASLDFMRAHPTK